MNQVLRAPVVRPRYPTGRQGVQDVFENPDPALVTVLLQRTTVPDAVELTMKP